MDADFGPECYCGHLQTSHSTAGCIARNCGCPRFLARRPPVAVSELPAPVPTVAVPVELLRRCLDAVSAAITYDRVISASITRMGKTPLPPDGVLESLRDDLQAVLLTL